MRKLGLTLLLSLSLLCPLRAQEAEPSGAFKELLMQLGQALMQKAQPQLQMPFSVQELDALRRLKLRPEQGEQMVALMRTVGPELLDENADASALISRLQPAMLKILDPAQIAVLKELDLKPEDFRSRAQWLREVAQDPQLLQQVHGLPGQVLQQMQSQLPDDFLRQVLDAMRDKAKL